MLMFKNKLGSDSVYVHSIIMYQYNTLHMPT